MTRKNCFIAAIAAIALSFSFNVNATGNDVSCIAKHGLVYCQGEKGEKGDQGEQGPQGHQGEPGVVDQETLNEIYGEIDRVDKEDMRVKSGQVNDGTLTLRVEDMEKTRGRNEIYGKDVDIDVSSLDQSQEVSQNRTDINSNTTRSTENLQMNDRQNGVLRNHESRISSNEDRLDANDTLNDRQNNAIRNNAQGVAKNSERNDTQDTQISENTERSRANEQMDKRQNRVIVQNDRRSKSNEENISSNRTDIDNNTQNITNVYNHTKNFRKDIDINSYGIESNRQAIADTNARIDGVMSDMKYLDKNLSAGIAASIAIGQHQFNPSYKSGQISLSGGFYNGQNAVSLAVGVPVGDSAFFSASIAADSGSRGESGGVGVTFLLP